MGGLKQEELWVIDMGCMRGGSDIWVLRETGERRMMRGQGR